VNLPKASATKAIFDFKPKKNYNVDFTDEGECVVNGWYTGDLFDVAGRKFLKRKDTANGKTWKSNV